VNELLREISGPELMEWLAMEEVEGLPNPWAETGMICAAMAGGTPQDYMPRRNPTRTDAAEGLKTVLDLAAANRREVGRKR